MSRNSGSGLFGKAIVQLLSGLFGGGKQPPRRTPPRYPKAATSVGTRKTPTPPKGKSYPVGIVGEASHQDAIKRCAVGERVQIVYEIGNPHDSHAIAVVRKSGARIGYIGKTHWLYDAINTEGKGCTATIITIEGKPLGVVIDVVLTNRQLGARDWTPQG